MPGADPKGVSIMVLYTDNVQELSPIYDRRQSFYHKAYTADCHTTEGETFNVLWSYDTPVAAYDKDGFHRLWIGWSATTGRHVDEYRRQHGDDGLSKAEWEDTPVERTVQPWEPRPRECKPYRAEYY